MEMVMSEDKRYRDFSSYIAGYEDAKNSIAEHYEQAKKEHEERHKRITLEEKYLAIDDEAVLLNGYDEYFTLLLDEQGKYVELAETGSYQPWDVLGNKLKDDLKINIQTMFKGDDYEVLLEWNLDETFGMLKKHTELHRSNHITFEVDCNGEENGSSTMSEFVDSWAHRLSKHRHYIGTSHMLMDFAHFRAYRLATGYTHSICRLKQDNLETEDDRENLINMIEGFWNLEWDEFIEQFDKRNAWAAFHSETDAKVNAFWSIQNS